MQNQQPQQQKINLEFTIDEINVIMMGLVKLPYETSAQLVDTVRIQASTQIQEMQKSAPTNGNLDGVNVNSVQ
jgi:hypothetical protein